MAISRRSFIKAGIMGTICAGIPLTFTNGVRAQLPEGRQSAGVSGIRIPSESQPALYNNCTKSNFSKYVNTKFLVYRKTGEAEKVTLVKVSDLKPDSGKRSAMVNQAESFSLMFRGSGSNPLEQGTYTIKHDDLGVFNLFLVAVGLPISNQNYQVIFNRSVREL